MWVNMENIQGRSFGHSLMTTMYLIGPDLANGAFWSLLVICKLPKERRL